MITGQVTADHEAIVELTLLDPHGGGNTLFAVVDTGFSGDLTVSPALIAQLGLPVLFDRVEATLADGSMVELALHRGRVIWDGQILTVEVLAGDGGPLIGMSLLYGYRLCADVLDGGAVTIEPVPGP
jgi:clan AA aspartic protease